jgi:hypothetical protein
MIYSENRFPLFRTMLGLRLPLHGTPEKGRKDCPVGDNMPLKGGQIEVIGVTVLPRRASIRPIKANNMGGTGKRSEFPGTEDRKSRKPPPAPAGDDDIEDGDFATPKRDRHGDDHHPVESC